MIGRASLELGRRGHGLFAAGCHRRHHRHHSRQPDPPLGVRTTLAAGGMVMAAAFRLPGADAWRCRFISLGCLLMGLGFTLLATVPGTYLLARLFRQSVFRLRALFHRGRLGRRGGAAALSLDRRAHAELARLLAGLCWSWSAAVGLISAVLVDVKTDVAWRSRCRSGASPTRDWPVKGGAADAAIRRPGRGLQHLPVRGHYGECGVGGASDEPWHHRRHGRRHDERGGSDQFRRAPFWAASLCAGSTPRRC